MLDLIELINAFNVALITIYFIATLLIFGKVFWGIVDENFELKYYHLLFPLSFIMVLLFGIIIGAFYIISIPMVFIYNFLTSPVFKEKDINKYE